MTTLRSRFTTSAASSKSRPPTVRTPPRWPRVRGSRKWMALTSGASTSMPSTSASFSSTPALASALLERLAKACGSTLRRTAVAAVPLTDLPIETSCHPPLPCAMAAPCTQRSLLANFTSTVKVGGYFSWWNRRRTLDTWLGLTNANSKNRSLDRQRPLQNLPQPAFRPPATADALVSVSAAPPCSTVSSATCTFPTLLKARGHSGAGPIAAMTLVDEFPLEVVAMPMRSPGLQRMPSAPGSCFTKIFVSPDLALFVNSVQVRSNLRPCMSILESAPDVATKR
mmetsp:Transcript_19176/g.57353  ORF Transcript_19176/g.57353 Transcript_19176/m.57353 type:complete len:283 (+) Transcript_19176:1762-2610(+)